MASHIGMNNNAISVTGLSIVIMMLALLGVSIVRPALALVDALSSPPSSDDTSAASTTTSNATTVVSTFSPSTGASSSAVATGSSEQASPPATGQTARPELKESALLTC
jgi:hypothetical protein